MVTKYTLKCINQKKRYGNNSHLLHSIITHKFKNMHNYCYKGLS